MAVEFVVFDGINFTKHRYEPGPVHTVWELPGDGKPLYHAVYWNRRTWSFNELEEAEAFAKYWGF